MNVKEDYSMSRKAATSLVNEIKENEKLKEESNFKELIKSYYELNEQKKKYDSSVKKLNTEIKDYMSEHHLEVYNFDDYSVKKSISERVKFNEDLLVQIIREMGREDLIKTKEYVDLDELEREIYRESIDASKLAPSQNITEVVTLNVRKKSILG